MSKISITNAPTTEAVLVNPEAIPGERPFHRAGELGSTALAEMAPLIRAENKRGDLIDALFQDPTNPSEIQKFEGYNYFMVHDRSIAQGPIVATRPVSYYENDKFVFLDEVANGREFSEQTTDKFSGIIDFNQHNSVSQKYGIDPRCIWIFRAGNFLPLRLNRNSREGIYIPKKAAFERIDSRDLQGCVGMWSTIHEMGREAPSEAWDGLEYYASKLLKANPGLKTELKR